MHINLGRRPEFFFLKGIFQGGGVAQWEQKIFFPGMLMHAKCQDSVAIPQNLYSIVKIVFRRNWFDSFKIILMTNLNSEFRDC